MSVNTSRSPHGERGLKYLQAVPVRFADKTSLPSRGAWIEIHEIYLPGYQPHRRSPHGERGLKCRWDGQLRRLVLSLPSRGAWIEICATVIISPPFFVAPLTGSVD